MVNAGRIDLERDLNLDCGITNRAGTLGWFGTYLSPGRIVKVDLVNMKKIETLVLKEGENRLLSAVIDGDERYGYFGTENEPAQVIKVDLETMTRVEAIALPPGEGNLGAAITNDAGTVGYFATNTMPASIVAIDLESFQRIGSLIFPATESFILSAVADESGEFGYFGCNVDPARIVKVDLENMSRVDSLALPGLLQPRQGIVGPGSANAYFCFGTSPAALARIDLTDFTTYDVLTFNAGLDSAVGMLIDADATSALLALFDGRVARVDLIGFAFDSVQPAIGINTGFNVPTAVRPTDVSDTGYFAYANNPGTIVQAAISTGQRSAPLYLDYESYPTTSVQDDDSKFAYFGSGVHPGSVVKVDLEKMQRVDSLALLEDERAVLCSAIDGSDRYAYFGTTDVNPDVPAKLVKVDLDSFTRVGAIAFPGDTGVESIALDEVANQAWVALSNDNADKTPVAFRIDLNTFQAVGAEKVLAPGPGGIPMGAAYDPIDQKVYFGTAEIPMKLYQATQELSIVEKFTAPIGYNRCRFLTRHPKNGRLYAGLGFTSGGLILSFDPQIPDFFFLYPTPFANGVIPSGAILPSGESGLFTLGGFVGGEILKIDSGLAGVEASLPLPIDNADEPRGLLLSPEGDRAWYGRHGAEAFVGGVNLFPRDQIKATKFQLGSSASVESVNFYSHAAVGIRRAQGVRFARGFDAPSCAAFDRITGRAIFGTATYPGQLVAFDTAGMSIAATRTLDPGNDDLECAFLEPGGEFACFGTFTSPGRVHRVRTSDLGPEDFLELIPGEDNLIAADVEPSGAHGYFAASTSPAKIVKVRLDNLTRVDGLTLEEGEDLPKVLIVDLSGEFAYVGCGTFPGQVVKIRLSDFSRVGSLPFEVGEDVIRSGAIDPTGTFAYFGTDTVPAHIVRVRLSDFTRVEALTLRSEEFAAYGMDIDPAGERLVVGLASAPGKVAMIDLATFSEIETARLRDVESSVTSALMVDASGENAYLGIGSNPGRVVRVEFFPKPLRVGLYGNSGDEKELLWQSSPVLLPASEEWVNVPISQGNPASLSLPPDEYWLAWQVDASTTVASYSTGDASEGLSLYWPHGPFPETLAPGAKTAWTYNTDRWSAYISYNDPPSPTPSDTPESLVTLTPTPSNTVLITPTNSSTPLPTASATPSLMPTPTETPTPAVTNVYNIYPDPPDAIVDANDLIHWLPVLEEPGTSRFLLFDFARFWISAIPTEPMKSGGGR